MSPTPAETRRWLEQMADHWLAKAPAELRERTPLIGETTRSRGLLTIETKLRGPCAPEGVDADGIGYIRT